jgi:altronate dehydratase
VIFFTTGNGSITNFPFAPTIKIVTTTQRYQLLPQEMDVNAGAYLDGASMADLGREMFELTLAVASGQLSAGEKAKHAQTQIWRDWRQTNTDQLDQLLHSPQPTGASLPLAPKPCRPGPDVRFQAIRRNGGYTTDQLGLILPTSLCAGQVARMTAEGLNQKGLGREQKLSRFVSLVHTEGCGVSSGASEELYIRTLLGYLNHPLVKHCLLLEHGCEKTHNDYMRRQIEQLGLDPERLGWASIQLDGGIDQVRQRIEQWFTQELAQTTAPVYETVGLEALRVGLSNAGPISKPAAAVLAELTRFIVSAGGTVVVPDNAALLAPAAGFVADVLGDRPARASLAYGQQLSAPGFHLMETPSSHWVETLTGLGATGVELILGYVGQHPMQSHPMIPLLQISAEPELLAHYGEDLDLSLAGDSSAWLDLILQRIVAVMAHQYIPKLYRQGNFDFQITRGLLGVSL